MNVLVLIKKLDSTPLQREVRSGGAHGEVITFYNENDNDMSLIIDEVEYSNIVQVCIIFKDWKYYIYIQQGENPIFIKLGVDGIGEISCLSSL